MANLRNPKRTPSKEDTTDTTTDHETFEESDSEIYTLIPLRQRSRLLRLDVGPFFVVYAGCIALDQSSIVSPRMLVTTILIVSLLLHLSVVLMCQWSVPIRAQVAFFQAKHESLAHWTHCLVTGRPVNSSPVAGIVSITLRSDNFENPVAVVNFHDTIFRFSSAPDVDITLWQSSTVSSLSSSYSPRFRRLFYPVQLPLSFYAAWKGHVSLNHVTQASRVYGANRTVVQLPTFLDLLSEQVVAPFFLFQILCVVLWSLDEYWYYAVFTLMALLMFESTLAYNRLNGLQRLHQAGHQGADRVWVRRWSIPGRMQWIMVPTRELVPGDVVSLAAWSAHGTVVPADILLLTGQAVVDEALLTGESMPQRKQALDVAKRDERLDVNHPEYKESILFGGTVVLVGTHDEEALEPNHDAPPDAGVVGMVLRTGFETAQGNLLRTMAHSSKNADSIHNMDTLVFILLLLICAIGAAGMVLVDGWYDDRRNRFRLVLHVVIIVTSVVPPELPMELSLAVTNSVSALMTRCKVYCTELYRIPWAGEVDVCCFDKTGTLTSDLMELRGVRMFGDNMLPLSNEDGNLILPKDQPLPWPVIRIMAGCHSLATTINNSRGLIVIGDTLEQAVLQQSGFQLRGSNFVTPVDATVADSNSKRITILHRFAFSSKLRRMTVLVTEGDGKQRTILALTKGAPEALKSLLDAKSVPSDYNDVSLYHMGRGRRVLAMAFKDAGKISMLGSLKEGGRGSVETNLQFAGFLVLDCPLKPDSKVVISQLRKGCHDVVMITGDALLTAAEVARQVGIIPTGATVYKIRPPYPACDSENAHNRLPFECELLSSSTGPKCERLFSGENLSGLKQLVKDGKAAFCLSGDDLNAIIESMFASSHNTANGSSSKVSGDEKDWLQSRAAQSTLTTLVPIVTVFGRHAPYQKEAVVAAMNHNGRRTLMCGDGTNDVGALKRAHIGISIVSAPEVESRQREATAKLAKFSAEEKRELKMRKKGGKTKKRSDRTGWEESIRQLKEAQDALEQVELGDASVAAPFTSRSASIKCCKDVIQQGRCTLVTMLQIYKILGINCLVNAMVLSKLFLHGVKQGDRQLTILGFLVAALFYFVTRAEPLPDLAPLRPPSSVLCAQALLSIALQFGVHCAAILLATYTALVFVDPFDPSLVPDGPFNPNVLNTCTFLLSCLATINTFAVNYRGRPFMRDLRENKLLYLSLQASYAVLIVCASEIFPPLNDLMQLSTLPTPDEIEPLANPLVSLVFSVGFPTFLLGLMAVDTVLAFALEKAVLRFVKQ